MKVNRLLFFLGIFLIPVAAAHSGEPVDDACRKTVEALRVASLSALFRAEENFKNSGWTFQKYQQTVYNSLWEALLTRRDRFAEAPRKAEAEMLYQRYRIQADHLKQQAEGELRFAIEEMKQIRKGLIRDESCGAKIKTPSSDDISLFNNCTEIWVKEAGDLIKELQVLLEDFLAKENVFSENIEKHLEDNVSDHDAYTDRFRDYFLETDLKSKAEFLELSQKIKMKFEDKWPGETCCALCHQDKRFRWDPVLNQVALDPQGEFGAAGNVVNNSRLVPAFKKFDKAMKEEKEAEEEKS